MILQLLCLLLDGLLGFTKLLRLGLQRLGHKQRLVGQCGRLFFGDVVTRVVFIFSDTVLSVKGVEAKVGALSKALILCL